MHGEMSPDGNQALNAMDSRLHLLAILILSISCRNGCAKVTSMLESSSELDKRQTSCGDGFYDTGSSGQPNCQRCPENCKRCRNANLCLECIDGKYGDTCEMTCDSLCKTCAIPYPGASWSRCTECPPNVWGQGCFYNCSYCAGGLCSRTGCLNGCIEGWKEYGSSRLCVKCPSPSCASCDPWSWHERRCQSCIRGKWGSLCDQDCSAACPSNNCNQNTGQCECMTGTYLDSDNNVCKACPGNCLECSSPTSCSKCVEGKYGDTCQHNCVAHCLECGPERVYNEFREVWETCSTCEKGFYKKDVCFPCEDGCSDCWWMHYSKALECRACTDGYYLDRRFPDREITKCSRCPPGCRQCNFYGECQSCLEGYFQFEHTCCPNNCEACSSPTACTNCKPGYHGDTCQLSK